MPRNTKNCWLLVLMSTCPVHLADYYCSKGLLKVESLLRLEGRSNPPWRPARYGRGSCNAAPITLAKNPRRG